MGKEAEGGDLREKKGKWVLHKAKNAKKIFF